MASTAAALPLNGGEVQPTGAAPKRQAQDLQVDVAGTPDKPKAFAKEDEFSAFTQFGRTQEHLSAPADAGKAQPAGATSPTSGAPAAPAPAPAPQPADEPSGKPWWSALVCGCFAPPPAPVETGSGQLRARRTMTHSLVGVPPSTTMRPRRTLSKQVSMYGGARRTLSAVKSTYSDDQWFDALSVADPYSEAGRALNAELEGMMRDMPTIGEAPPVQEPGPHVPDPPLEMANKDFIFVPVPKETGFAGYWLKDEERTTPNPQPIDLMLNSSKMAQKAHETIPGIWLQETPSSFTMTAKPRSIPLGPLSRYVETFNKDGSTTWWNMRRDIKVGRSSGQLFFTACGTLIFRVYAKGMWGDASEYVCEEYSRLEDEGNTIISRQCCKHMASGKTATQYLIGEWAGDSPPPGHV